LVHFENYSTEYLISKQYLFIKSFNGLDSRSYSIPKKLSNSIEIVKI